MPDYYEKQRMVAEACAQFPGEFGLRGHPGEIFRVSESASHFAFGEVQIYLQGLYDGKWLDFAKGTVAELRREMVPLKK